MAFLLLTVTRCCVGLPAPKLRASYTSCTRTFALVVAVVAATYFQARDCDFVFLAVGGDFAKEYAEKLTEGVRRKTTLFAALEITPRWMEIEMKEELKRTCTIR